MCTVTFLKENKINNAVKQKIYLNAYDFLIIYCPYKKLKTMNIKKRLKYFKQNINYSNIILHNLKIIQINEKGTKIVVGGYAYTLQHTLSKTKRWKCNKKTKYNCPGILSSSWVLTNSVLQIEQNHTGNNQIQVIENFKNDIKSRSRKTCDKPSQIFAEAVSQLAAEAQLFLPKESVVKRTIRNQRTNNNSALNCINDIVIEDDWALVNGQQFLLADNKSTTGERIVLFATDDNLKMLTETKCGIAMKNDRITCSLEGMAYLKTIVSPKGEDLLNYFDLIYVNGPLRKLGLVDSRQKLLIINLYKTKMLQQPTLRIKEVVKIISKELGIGQRTTQSTIAEYKSEKPVRSPNKTKIRATFKEKIDDFEQDAIRRKGRTIYYLYETWVNAGDCNERIWQDNTVTSRREAFVRGLSTGAPNPTAKGKRLIVVNIGAEEGFVDGGLLVFESKKGSADYHEEMNGDVFFDWLKGVIPLLKDRGGLTRAKAEIISKTFSEIDVLTLQETRVPEEETSRLKIPGFELVSCIGHNKHGLATYINQNKSFGNIERVAGNDNATGVRIDNLTIFNVYKPPSRNWSTMVLPTCQHPVIYIGDFNSHSTDWGYSTENEDGEALSNWAALNHLKLIYGAKQGGTFISGRWGIKSSPDLCFVSEDIDGLPLNVNREILGPFPRSQHLPVIVEVGISIPIIDKPFMPRWNLRKAN
ncbi:hypothetical protein QTP88_001245 [Uroleucon formosanum]